MIGRLPRTAGLVLAAVLTVECGGGGGGGGGVPTTPVPPPPPPAPTTGILFSASGMPGDGSIFLDAAGQTNANGIFTLRIEAREVTDLYGVSFDLEFPNDRLRWVQGARKGPFLGIDGAETRRVVRAGEPGTLVIGVTILGEFAGVSGSGTLLELDFEAREGEGEGEFVFSGNEAFDADGRFLDLEWIAGSVEVRR